MNSTNNLALSFVLAGIVCLSVFFVTFSLATLIFAFFILLFGNIFSYIVANKKSNFTEVKIYNIVFSFYIFLAINYFLGYQADWASFTQDWRDEYNFFIMTESNQYLSITQNYKDSFIDRIYIEYGLYVFYISSLASIAHNYFDGNHLLLQFLGSTLFGVLSSAIVYKILNLYVDSNKAYKYTLIFMFLSIFNFYSYSLIRDVAIAFFFICGIYFSLNSKYKHSIRNLFLMFLCNWLIFELRVESGLIYALMTLYVVFNTFKKNKILLLVFGLMSVSFAGFMLAARIDSLLMSFNSYSDFTNDSINNNEGGLSQYAYSLPPVIKEITIAFLSQIQPFPSWLNVISANNPYQVLHGLLQIIYSFFWFVIFSSILKWLIIDKKISTLRTEFKVLLVILFIFLVSNSVNMSLRRIIGFYPFIFLIYVYLKEKQINCDNFKKVTLICTLVYISMIFIYLFIKK